MQYLSRKEFINYAGIKSNANYAQYVTRGKIIVEVDGTINIENKQNKDWLMSRAAKGLCPDFTSVTLGVTPEPKQEQKKTVSVSSDKSIEQIELSNSSKKKIERTVTSRHEVELEKLKAELEKKLVDTELAREKLATVKGNSVPVDLVKDIMSQFSKAIINNYKSFNEQQIAQICHKFRIEDSERVKIVSKSVTELNKIHEKAVNEAKQQFKAIIGITRTNTAQEDEQLDD
jgi:hypothetical protein